MTNAELIKALKYIAHKKSAARQKINKHLKSKEDIINNPVFYDHADISDPVYNDGRYVPHPDDLFKLNDNGHNLLEEYAKETKAIRRVNLSLLLSFIAVLIAAAALIHSIFMP